jgi:hypothetical protein
LANRRAPDPGIHQDVSPIDHGELSLTLDLSEITLGGNDDRGLDPL